MPGKAMMRELFDRWERVWHEGKYDLIPSCVGPTYIRHDEKGGRTVTREAYAAVIAQTRQERPNLRFVVYDHSFEGDRAWFRFAFKWHDPKTGETRTRAGMQVYRVEGGFPENASLTRGIVRKQRVTMRREAPVTQIERKIFFLFL